MERSVEIDRPVGDVFNYVRFIDNHRHFSIWQMADPDMEVTSTGEDGQVGYVHSWDSQVRKVGAGSQEITEILGRERISYELRFERPMRATNYSNVHFLSLPHEHTRVTWDFSGEIAFPMSLFSFFIRRMLARDIDKNLANLKDKLEE
ncbi:SRPBCC family protein [Lewinella sp. IMCC34191]|uniref:SRPBCC family protein n=1 Tax=Lewinella sp. IMCC34191 TaxID=2259172 RepID=UPI0013009729|nr:SRPBCC family protein [Lewinella sp. IMCC34191]